MQSLYLDSPTRSSRHNRFQKFVSFKAFFTLTIALFIGFGGVLTSYNQSQVEKAQGFDTVQFIMCMWGDDSIPQQMYQVTQSSDLQFQLRSRSAMTFGIDDVDTGLNWLLQASGSTFNANNEKILGQKMDRSKSTTEDKLKFNSGKKINPYDRFGVAGLKFSAYQGEWKHVVIDACSEENDATDPEAGVYYDDRLEPRSTWEDIDSSKDVRTKQFSKNIAAQYLTSLVNMIANWIFTIAKFTVVMTVALINFAFSDVSELLGLNEILYGSADGEVTEGIISDLHENLFTPILVIMFVVTAFWLLYVGVAKARYREGFGGVIRGIVMVIFAFVFVTNPTILALPNSIAVGFQAIIIGAMNDSVHGSGEMCATDIGEAKTELADESLGEDSIDTETNTELLAESSENMKSVVSCTFWEAFLFKPWSQAQFGEDYNKLWAEGKIPDWANDDATTLDGDPSNEKGDLEQDAENVKMVGNASVPVGDGEFIQNWALYHLSTQTNAHSPTGDQGETSKYTNGVANDWWRVVDALANYSEEKQSVSNSVSPENEDGASSEDVDTYMAPKSTPVMNEWDVWTGNSVWGRMGTALTAVIIAPLGMLAPFVLALLSAVYAVGIAILMAFAPIMFLFGAGPPRFYDIFKAWVELVINTTLKRIITGVLITLVIILELIALEKMETIGWWQGMLMLILVSILVLKSRSKVTEMVANIRFATHNFAPTVNNLTQKMTRTASGSGKALMAGTAGGIASRRSGGSFTKGASAGAKSHVRNAAYTSQTGRAAMASFERSRLHQGAKTPPSELCAKCGRAISKDFDHDHLVARDSRGSYYCQMCYEDGQAPDDAVETMITQRTVKEQGKEEKRRNNENVENSSQENTQKPQKSRMDSDKEKDNIESIKSDDVELEDKHKNFNKLVNTISYDVQNARVASAESNSHVEVSMPTELKPYLSESAVSEAWTSGNYDYVQTAYTVAAATWFQETTGHEIDRTLDEIIADVGKHTDNLQKKQNGNDDDE